MAKHGRALGAARPVVTGAILTGRKRPTFGSRAGQDVMPARRKTHARNDLTPLGQRRVHAKLVIVAVQIVEVLSDDVALEILPWTIANAVTRIDGRLSVDSLDAQIGAPGFSSRAMTLRQLLTILVGTFKAAEIGAFAEPHAGDKERHVRRLRQLWRRLLWLLLLCFDAGHHAERRERQCGDNECLRLVHRTPLCWRFPDAHERVMFALLGSASWHRRLSYAHRQASHRRRDADAADRDGGRFERAVLSLVGGGDEDFGAGLEFALVRRHIGHDGCVRYDYDLLLHVLVSQGDLVALHAFDHLSDRSVGHGAVR